MRGLLANRPALYIGVLAFAMLATYPVKLRTQGAFACSAEGYRTDAYMGYCHGSGYGDYDHGAVWFGLEPGVQEYAIAADVLFLGSSRMQFAFSTGATDNWFSSHGATHYLLGFSHTENQTFIAPLLARLEPRAKVYVINVDGFFSESETGPGSEVLHDPNIRERYLTKKSVQTRHRGACVEYAWLCGRKFAYFRTVETGHFVEKGINRASAAAVGVDSGGSPEAWAHATKIAERFVSQLPVGRSCVLLTTVPHQRTPAREVEAIAGALGLEVVTPALDGLSLYDGSHLDPSSAERWSQSFFELAGARIQNCLGS